jgi:hypothetical protein
MLMKPLLKIKETKNRYILYNISKQNMENTEDLQNEVKTKKEMFEKTYAKYYNEANQRKKEINQRIFSTLLKNIKIEEKKIKLLTLYQVELSIFLAQTKNMQTKPIEDLLRDFILESQTCKVLKLFYDEYDLDSYLDIILQLVEFYEKPDSISTHAIYAYHYSREIMKEHHNQVKNTIELLSIIFNKEDCFSICPIMINHQLENSIVFYNNKRQQIKEQATILYLDKKIFDEDSYNYLNNMIDDVFNHYISELQKNNSNLSKNKVKTCQCN